VGAILIAELCSMTRPCECGFTVRIERRFGFTGTTSGAPGSSTVLKAGMSVGTAFSHSFA